jgi:protein-L-isoaspartate(D-aspartate) O-methyltransferase
MKSRLGRIKLRIGKMQRLTNLILFLFLSVAAVVVFTGFRCSTGSMDTINHQEKVSDANNEFATLDEKSRPLLEKRHPAFKEYVAERGRMVQTQMKARDINDPNVLRAMDIVPRHFFVHANYRSQAYDDNPLPIGNGQTISQPYIVAFMTQALKLEPNSKILEIGTGSGYQAAVCAQIAKEVYTIEIVKDLADKARKTLNELGYKNIFIKAGDGYFGWPEKGPFDAIIGTAAAERIPEPLLEQLKPGGRMILPYETKLGFQYLVLIIKDKQGKFGRQDLLPVTFVPMTGEVKKTK